MLIMQNSRKIAAEIIVSIAFILITIYIVDAGIARLNGGEGFILGGGSILFFFISFGIGFNIKSRLLTILLIVGGALIGTVVIISSFILPENSNITNNSILDSDNQMQQLVSPQFLGIIVIGYIIMVLGIIRAIRRK